eukprot:UN10858
MKRVSSAALVKLSSGLRRFNLAFRRLVAARAFRSFSASFFTSIRISFSLRSETLNERSQTSLSIAVASLLFSHRN